MAARGIIGSQESQESTKTVVPVRLEAHHKVIYLPRFVRILTRGGIGGCSGRGNLNCGFRFRTADGIFNCFTGDLLALRLINQFLSRDCDVCLLQEEEAPESPKVVSCLFVVLQEGAWGSENM